MKHLLYIIIILLVTLNVHGNRNEQKFDSSKTANNSFYTDYTDYIHLKPYILFKLNTLEVIHEDTKLRLNPNSPTAIGLSFNYKFAGIALGVGLPQSQENVDTYGKTNRLDLQISFFTKNIGFDGHLQLYKGYYLENPDDFMDWNQSYYPQIPDMQTISLGASAFYVVNNKRYSNKANIVRTQKQNQSAGSLLTGLFFSFDETDAPSGFFPSELPDSLYPDFDLKGFRYVAGGINLGYAYTFVLSKQFFLNATVISGGGYKYIRVSNNNGVSDTEKHIHGQIQLRASFGYELTRFFAGASASTLIRTIEYKQYEIDLATEQLRIYVGWRFL